MVHLIIGCGAIGEALWNLIGKVQYADLEDYHQALLCEYPVDILHIAFPYGEDFEGEVKRYVEMYAPTYVVIHSTVPVGTSAMLQATHSPIVGKHPHIKEALTTFTKFVGGKDADEVADVFRYIGMNVQVCRKSETTELAKLTSTMYYSLCIEFAKHAEELCNEHGVPFAEAYTLWNQNYNQGYEELGMDYVTRPILQPLQKKQGGHCTLNNLDLLKSKFANFIKEL